MTAAMSLATMAERRISIAACAVMLILAAGCTQPPSLGTTQHEPVYRDPSEDVLDHFLCYQIQSPAFVPPPNLRLIDQFNQVKPQPAFVLARDSLCVPVAKGGREVLHDDSHLVCYLLMRRNPVGQPVTMANQLGRVQHFTVNQELKLCLPSGKRKQTGSPPPPIPTDIDHFKCYLMQVPPTFPRVGVKLRDQFIDPAQNFTVVGPSFLCAPTEKLKGEEPGKPLLNPTAHLVCYALDAFNFQQTQVRITNQFEPPGGTVITVVRPTVLCVPSSKRLGHVTSGAPPG